MLTANIRNFMLTGRLDRLNCHMAEPDVIRVLGFPESTEVHPNARFAFYGCLQLQYLQSGQIAAISVLVDSSEFPHINAAMNLDRWHIRKRMTPEELAKVLSSHSIKFVESAAFGNIRVLEINNCTSAVFLAESPEGSVLWHLSSYRKDWEVV